jgi:hypothetical protein
MALTFTKTATEQSNVDEFILSTNSADQLTVKDMKLATSAACDGILQFVVGHNMSSSQGPVHQIHFSADGATTATNILDNVSGLAQLANMDKLYLVGMVVCNSAAVTLTFSQDSQTILAMDLAANQFVGAKVSKSGRAN